MAKPESLKWAFKARFRRHAFGWKSQPAIQRIKEAVAEIRQVAKQDKVLGAEGAVLFIERVSPAIEQVDSSSGAIGTAVNNAIDVLVGIIAEAPVDQATRMKWLDRLFEAHGADQMPYIERLADYWGELCASPELASDWADKLIGITRLSRSSDPSFRGYFHGTSACLSALFAAGRHDELIDLLQDETFWSYKRWAVKALAAQGKTAEAIDAAERCRGTYGGDFGIDSLCEEILLDAGLVDEAFERYGLLANRAGTYVAWFRAVVRKYPQRTPAQVLHDLVASTPGDEGKWFAAAKEAKMFAEAIELANRTPCSPQTLTRAARDYADTNPAFALAAGMTALRWLVEGYGYDVTSLDVLNAYDYARKAAENLGTLDETMTRLRGLVAKERFGERFVTKVIGRHLGLT